MGAHQKLAGLEIFDLLEHYGQTLGFYVQREEYMFPGSPTSPIFDMTWRRYPHEKSPLFIFEIESTPNKSTSDNAIKLFSRRTETFIKPLFFFHIFVSKTMNTDRIEYLKSAFDKLNYDSYLLTEESDHVRLFYDILDLYFRFEQQLDLLALLDLIASQSALQVSAPQVLDRLLQHGYDRLEDANFVSTLETFILHTNSQGVRDYYFSYLPEYLKLDNRPRQDYGYYYIPSGYSVVIQIALLLIVNGSADRVFWFRELYNIENSYESWPLWEPTFGLSQDHDLLLLYEFPLLLTMLCIAFKNTKYAHYFSGKLEGILVRYGEINNHSFGALIWLLIASRIAHNEKTFEIARNNINSIGGLPIDVLVQPQIGYSEEHDSDLMQGEIRIQVPSPKQWNETIQPYVDIEHIDLLQAIIGSFLIMNNWKDYRKLFANYCLYQSLT